MKEGRSLSQPGLLPVQAPAKVVVSPSRPVFSSFPPAAFQKRKALAAPRSCPALSQASRVLPIALNSRPRGPCLPVQAGRLQVLALFPRPDGPSFLCAARPTVAAVRSPGSARRPWLGPARSSPAARRPARRAVLAG